MATAYVKGAFSKMLRPAAPCLETLVVRPAFVDGVPNFEVEGFREERVLGKPYMTTPRAARMTARSARLGSTPAARSNSGRHRASAVRTSTVTLSPRIPT